MQQKELSCVTNSSQLCPQNVGESTMRSICGHLQEFCSTIAHQSSSIHVMSLKEESGRFFFHFREIFEKCIEYIGKFLIHFREILNFC